MGAQAFTWLLQLCFHIFLYGIARYTPPVVEAGPLTQTIGPHGLWLIPLVTTLGGAISGFLVYHFAPEAEGHGTDTAVNAFHRKEGQIRTRVPAIKMLASAVTIGSGGSAGREGPIALIAAGLGSIYARYAHRSEEERRLLVLVGMAAGLSAIFRSPIGTAIFAVEVLYGRMEFESRALLYTILSSTVAYTVNGAFVGFRPLFDIPHIPVPGIKEYGADVALGLVAGIFATALPQVFYGVRDLFRRLPIPLWTKPALGGLGVGLIALRLPQVLGGGYGWMQLAIDGKLALGLLLVLSAAKMVAFALTVSSGGSGGVFAPSLFIGAMLGGAFATLLHQVPAAFVVIGMAAVFGSAARVPIATILMVTEMTGGYQLLASASLAVMISYFLQVSLTQYFKYPSLYEGQVPRREDSPAHYLEAIQAALNLLGRRKIPLVDKLGHLDLLRLLRSRVRFDLPGGRELTMAVVPTESPAVGKTIGDLYEKLEQYDFEIVTVRRREHVLFPHPDTLIEPDDRLVMIVTPEARKELAAYVSPMPQIEESGVQLPATAKGA